MKPKIIERNVNGNGIFKKHPCYYERLASGITQKELAREMCVTAKAISKAENFDYQYADPKMISIILKKIVRDREPTTSKLIQNKS